LSYVHVGESENPKQVTNSAINVFKLTAQIDLRQIFYRPLTSKVWLSCVEQV